MDQPFDKFISVSNVPATATVRQLLNHTAGLSDYYSTPEYREAVQTAPDHPWTYARLMEVALRRTPRFPPGASWSYSNPGYALLKELIENLSGMGYFEFLERYIFRPHGLAETRGFVAPDAGFDLLEGDEPAMSGDFRPLYAPGWILPGCLISTAADVARFFDALFAGRIISADSLLKMTTTVHLPGPIPGAIVPSYGLGLMHGRNDPLGASYGHGGCGPGYTTYVRHYPKLSGRPFTVSLVLNKGLPRTPFELADAIVQGFLATQS